MLRKGLLAALVVLACGAAAPAESPAGKMLDRLKTLEGSWEGTLEWSQGRTGTGTLTASYLVTGHSSAVIETLVMGDAPSMTTVYHLDGGDLRMTHYCAAGNQPRLRASAIDEATRTATFAFVDVTDSAAHPAWVNAFQIRVLDDDHLRLEFTFGGGSGKGVETILLHRTPVAST
jgi:hypothetical protein